MRNYKEIYDEIESIYEDIYFDLGDERLESNKKKIKELEDELLNM
jgi:hypothetical protein